MSILRVAAGLLMITVLALPAHAQPRTTGAAEGAVTDTAGEPVEGAEVTVAGDTQATTETGEDGTWRIEGLEPGSYTVAFDDERFLPVWFDDARAADEADELAVQAGETTDDVDAVLVRGARVSGHVTGEDGAAVAGARVSAGDPEQVATTDDAGWFSLTQLWPGRVSVTAVAGRYRSATRTVDVGEGRSAQVDLALAPIELPVEVVSGEDRVATAAAGSRRAFPDGADAVVIAAAGAFPDALAAAPLAADQDGPLLLVGRRLGPVVTAELRRLGASRATIVGAVVAVSATVQAELEREGLTVERIAGDGRADTAALIARAVGPAASGEVIVVSGADFADAMSAAPLAAQAGIPILLANRDSLPEDTRAAIEHLQPERTLVVGGSAVVSDVVLAELPAPRRIAGPDRHATSAAVAELLLERGGSLAEVAVATGRDYPDGLASAPVIARRGGPLLLAADEPQHGTAVYAFLERHLADIDTVVVFGGDAAVSPAVRARLARPWESSQ